MDISGEINQRLVSIYNYFLEREYNPFYVALVGYQEEEFYHAADEMDVLVIVRPNKLYLYTRKLPINQTISTEWGNIHLMEPTEYFKQLENCKYRALESLYTDFYLISPDYEIPITEMRNHRGFMTARNYDRAINLLTNQVSRYIQGSDYDISINGYHALRLCEVIENIIAQQRNPFEMSESTLTTLRWILNTEIMKEDKKQKLRALKTDLNNKNVFLKRLSDQSFDLESWKEKIISIIMSEGD